MAGAGGPAKTAYPAAVSLEQVLLIFTRMRPVLPASLCLFCLIAMPAGGEETNATPSVTASISRPVNSGRDLPTLTLTAAKAVRDGRAVSYTARVLASLDSGEFTLLGTVRPEKGLGGAVDKLLSDVAAHPGFHAVRVKVEVERAGTSSPESYALPTLFYAVYDPSSESDAVARSLIYGPASTPGNELDPELGDEPFAAWLSGLISARRSPRDPAPEWVSDYCENRTADPTHQAAATSVCAVIYFTTHGEIHQIWFRTADIRETERGIEWVPRSPAQFEGMTVNRVPGTPRLSSLPSLLDAPSETRPTGDISILPDDIVAAPAAATPGAPLNVTITVRNIGHQDLYKVTVDVGWGVDSASRPKTRQFVVDVPQQSTTDVTLQVTFPSGYGFVMAQATTLGEHAPHDTWTPDPTPDDDCALRVINAELAPPRYRESLLDAAGPGCTGK